MLRRWCSSATAPRRVLCSLNELKARDGAAIKFPLIAATAEQPEQSPHQQTQPQSQPQRRAARGGRSGFVFFCEESQAPRAFVNSCPHALLELDLDDSDFFCDGFVQCKAHGAFFDPQTGICLQGPAAPRRGRLGKQLGALTELTVRVEGEEVVLVEKTRDSSPQSSRTDQEWLDYRAKRQRELSTVLAGRQDDVQRMQAELHAKTMARMQQYAQRKADSPSKK